MDQNHWRFCQKCNAMFFDGFPSKGVCPAGGGHEAQGFDFSLPHDVPPTANAQNNWRFCDKCHAMFFDGFANKGHCPAGSGHHAQGFNFVLPHSVGFGAPEVMNFDSGAVHVPGGLTLQGSAHLVVRRNGEFTFTSHAHNSGFDNINYSLAAVLRAPSGQVAFTFQKQGRVEGTVAGLPFGTPQRNDDFTNTGHNARLAAELASLSNGGKFVVNLNGTDLLLHGITGLIQDTLQDAAKQLAQGAAGAVVALVAA